MYMYMLSCTVHERLSLHEVSEFIGSIISVNSRHNHIGLDISQFYRFQTYLIHRHSQFECSELVLQRICAWMNPFWEGHIFMANLKQRLFLH